MSYQHTNSKGKVYYLNAKMSILNDGKSYPLYYFSKDYRKDTACDLPEDRIVVENLQTGLPMLKHKRKP